MVPGVMGTVDTHRVDLTTEQVHVQCTHVTSVHFVIVIVIIIR